MSTSTAKNRLPNFVRTIFRVGGAAKRPPVGEVERYRPLPADDLPLVVKQKEAKVAVGHHPASEQVNPITLGILFTGSQKILVVPLGDIVFDIGKITRSVPSTGGVSGG